MEVVRIGLTGGIASGKSVVAGTWQRLGVSVVDLDLLGREITENDPQVRQALVALWGPTLLQGTRVDRKALRERFFQDPEKRRQTESILHRAIWARYLEREKQEALKGKRLVVCEAALLIEASLVDQFRELIVVLAPEAQRLQRLLERDQISPELAQQMIDTQTNDATRQRLATKVLMNDGIAAHLEQQAHGIYQRWKAQKWVD